MPSQGLSGSPGAVPDVLTDCDGGSTTCAGHRIRVMFKGQGELC